MTSNLDTAPLADAAAPPVLTPGGRSAMRSLLVVTAIVVTLSAAAGIGGLAWGISSVRVAAETETLPADFSSLTIFLNHAINSIGIVLQISIHGNNSVDIHAQCLH